MQTLIKALRRVIATEIVKKLPSSAFAKSEYDAGDDDALDPPENPPKILYHVTHIKNLDSIKQKGITPRVGSITQSGHGDKQNPATPLVYLSDVVAPGILGTFGKNAIIITVNPFDNQISLFDGMGLLDIDGSGGWGSYTEEGDFPIGIEPGDFFSESNVTPLAFYDHKGNLLP